MIQTAVILAAGLGTRFGSYTEVRPKGFIPFKGKAMVLRAIDTMLQSGIEKIIIGTGYHREWYEALTETYPQVQCVFSPRFAETNSMYTLWNCREAIGDDDFLLFESDLVFEQKALAELLGSPYDSAMLVAPVTKFQDQYYVERNEKDELTNCSTDKTALHPCGELVGIHKISNAFYRILCEDYAAKADECPKLGYEYELLHISRTVRPLYVVKCDDLQWYEIDDTDDLAYAEEHISID